MSDARDVVKSIIEHHLKSGFMTKDDILEDLSANHNVDRETTESVWQSLKMENSAILNEYLVKVGVQELMSEQYDSTLISSGSQLMSELESIVHSDPTLIHTPDGSQSSSSTPLGPGPPVNFQQANQTMLENVQPLMQQGPINMGGHSVTIDMPQNSMLGLRAPFHDTSAMIQSHSGSPTSRTDANSQGRRLQPGVLLAPRPSVNWQEIHSLLDQDASSTGGTSDVLGRDISSNLATMRGASPSQHFIGDNIADYLRFVGSISNPSGLLGAVPGRFSSSDIRADVTANHGNRINLKKDPQKIPKPTRKPFHDPNPLLSGQAQPQPIIRYEQPTAPIKVSNPKEFRDTVQRLTGWDRSTPPTNITRRADANSQQQGAVLSLGPPVNFGQANQAMPDNVGAFIVQPQIPRGPSIMGGQSVTTDMTLNSFLEPCSSNAGMDVSTTLRTDANAQNSGQQQDNESGGNDNDTTRNN